MSLEEESFIWEISLLGNLGSCFHCKKNGHTKKECSVLVNLKNPRFETMAKSNPKEGDKKVLSKEDDANINDCLQSIDKFSTN